METSATLYSCVSTISDILGAFTGLYLIEKMKRKTLFIFSYLLVTISLGSFSLFGYVDYTFMYKYIVIFYRYVQSLGVGAVYWSYVIFFNFLSFFIFNI